MSQQTIRVGDLTVDPHKRHCWLRARRLILQPADASVLYLLALKSPGEVSRDDLCAVAGVTPRSLRAVMSRIRAQLVNGASTYLGPEIISIPRGGYKLAYS